MIPAALIKLIEHQPGNIRRSDRPAVIEALNPLDIDLQSQLTEFFLSYVTTFLQANARTSSYVISPTRARK
jgi:hypothetical protein